MMRLGMLFGVLLVPTYLSAAPVDLPAPQRAAELTLAQAVQLAVARNVDILIARLDRQAQEQGVAIAWGAFMPQLTANIGYHNTTPLTLTDPRDQRLGYQAGVTWHSPIGTELSTAFAVDQHIGGLSDTTHYPALTITLRQALLNGGWLSGAATDLRQGALSTVIARHQLCATIEAFILEVTAAYWELAYAQEDMVIKGRSLTAAKQRYEDTKENIKRGVIAPSEVYVVEENLVYFEEEETLSNENLAAARRRLALLLQLELDSPLTAVDSLDTAPTTAPLLDEAQTNGLAHNPSLAIKKLQLDYVRLTKANAVNQLLPTLDLFALVSLAGTSDNLTLAFDELGKSRRPAAQVGLSLSLPLFYHPARTTLSRAMLYVHQGELALFQTQTTVYATITDLTSRLGTRLQRLQLAKRRRQLTQLKLDAENEKYANGISTLADVVRFQRDLDQALISYRRLQVEIFSLYNQLLQAQGLLATSMDIAVQ